MNKPFFPPTAGEELTAAVEAFHATPHEIAWLYVRAAHRECGRNVSETARRLGMHRRTVQRMLAAGRPTRVTP